MAGLQEDNRSLKLSLSKAEGERKQAQERSNNLEKVSRRSGRYLFKLLCPLNPHCVLVDAFLPPQEKNNLEIDLNYKLKTLQQRLEQEQTEHRVTRAQLTDKYESIEEAKSAAMNGMPLRACPLNSFAIFLHHSFIFCFVFFAKNLFCFVFFGWNWS